METKMAQTSLLQVRIDTELKQAAEELFADIGLGTSSVIRLFLTQAVARQEIPFQLTRPAKNSGEKESELKVWQGLTPGMKTPIHIGEGFRMYSKEELHER
jgi:addiction module RelB/DinJ family antitoxin